MSAVNTAMLSSSILSTPSALASIGLVAHFTL